MGMMIGPTFNIVYITVGPGSPGQDLCSIVLGTYTDIEVKPVPTLKGLRPISQGSNKLMSVELLFTYVSGTLKNSSSS